VTMKRMCASVLLAGLATGVCAQNSGPPSGGPGGQSTEQQGGRPRMGPPPEAIAACSGKASGAACSFTGRQGEALTGTCFAPPPRSSGTPGQGGGTGQGPGGQGERPLACRPDRGGPGQGGPGQGGQGGQGGPGGSGPR